MHYAQGFILSQARCEISICDDHFMLPTSCRTVATRISTQLMAHVDTNPLRALRIAGWAFVGLVVVDVLLCFRILQLLHTPCTACCECPLLHCGPFAPSAFNTSLHEFSFRFFPLSSHCRSGPLLRSRRMQ